MDLHPDLTELLTELGLSGAEYLVVGGWAVGVHSEPRYTKDLDLLIGTSPENLERVVRALEAYGAPPGLIQDIRTMKPHEFVFFGTPPARVERIGHSTCAFPFRDEQPRDNAGATRSPNLEDALLNLASSGPVAGPEPGRG